MFFVCLGLLLLWLASGRLLTRSATEQDRVLHWWVESHWCLNDDILFSSKLHSNSWLIFFEWRISCDLKGCSLDSLTTYNVQKFVRKLLIFAIVAISTNSAGLITFLGKWAQSLFICTRRSWESALFACMSMIHKYGKYRSLAAVKKVWACVPHHRISQIQFKKIVVIIYHTKQHKKILSNKKTLTNIGRFSNIRTRVIYKTGVLSIQDILWFMKL